MLKHDKRKIIDSLKNDIFLHRLSRNLPLPFKTGTELKEHFLSDLPYEKVISILRQAADEWNETDGQKMGILVDWDAFTGCWRFFGLNPEEKKQDFADLVYIGANRVCGHNARSVKNFNLTTPLVRWEKKDVIFNGMTIIDPTKGILKR